MLTDEDHVPYAVDKTADNIYHNLMKLDYDNTRTRSSYDITQAQETERKSEIELVSEFFEKQNGKQMTEQQLEYASDLIEQINWRSHCETDKTCYVCIGPYAGNNRK
ncbi:MAG: exonuclease SbcCD subunit D C-terminal domain-containing protein [Ruminococcus sp.]